MLRSLDRALGDTSGDVSSLSRGGGGDRNDSHVAVIPSLEFSKGAFPVAYEASTRSLDLERENNFCYLGI